MDSISPDNLRKFRKYCKGLVVDFLIEINVVTIAVYLCLMYQIQSIGAPIFLCIGFLIFYDLIELRYNIVSVMTGPTIDTESLLHDKTKNKHLIVEIFFSIFFKICLLVMIQARNHLFIYLTIPASLMLLQRIRMYCVFIRESECINIINIIMVASRLLLLLATISISLKVDGYVTWDWGQTFWFFWVFFSISVGCNFALLLMVISKTIQLCSQRRQAKSEELRAIVWFAEINLAASLGSYLWVFGTMEQLRDGSSPKLMFFLILLVCHFCLQAIISTCWFDSILDTLVMLLHLDQGTAFAPAPTTQDTQNVRYERPTSPKPHQILKAPKLLQRISATYFGVQTKQRRIETTGHQILDVMSSRCQEPITDRNSLIGQLGSRRNMPLTPGSDIVLQVQSTPPQKLTINALPKEKPVVEHKGQKDVLQRQDSNRNCLVCFDKPPNGVYMSCGHGGICYDCALDLWDKNNVCYLCRQVPYYQYHQPIQQLLEIDVNSKDNDFIKVMSATQAVTN